MGYKYEDAWKDLYDLFRELKPNEESETPFDNRSKKWIRNKMEEFEKLVIR